MTNQGKGFCFLKWQKALKDVRHINAEMRFESRVRVLRQSKKTDAKAAVKKAS